MIRLIAADMDGTLLDSHKQLPPDFPEVFARLRERGIAFVAASGRFYPKQREQFSEYLDEMYFLCDNGASVVYRGEWLRKNILPREKLHRLLAACAGIPRVMPILCAAETCYFQPVSERFVPSFTSYFGKGQVTEDLFSVKDEILKVAICDLDGSAEHAWPILSREMGDALNLVVSGQLWMDAMNPGVNKGEALAALQRRLGVTPAETMAFGDYDNDIEMLRRAEYSFVMENAAPAMRRHARFVAASNDCGGVTRAIREFLLTPAGDCISGENVLQ